MKIEAQRSALVAPDAPPEILKLIAEKEKHQLLLELCSQIPEELIRVEIIEDKDDLLRLTLKVSLEIKLGGKRDE